MNYCAQQLAIFCCGTLRCTEELGISVKLLVKLLSVIH